jgi:hypothetical protein
VLVQYSHAGKKDKSYHSRKIGEEKASWIERIAS